jgi:Holliday junction resolvasome RuvABC endonuclease subunit
MNFTPKKTKVPRNIDHAGRASFLLHQIKFGGLSRDTIGFDQALDTTGFAVILRNITDRDVIINIFRELSLVDDRYLERLKELRLVVDEFFALKEIEDHQIRTFNVKDPANNRKKPVCLGFIASSSSTPGVTLILNGAIGEKASPKPEWQRAALTADKVLILVKIFEKYHTEGEMGAFIEGMALHGSAGTTAILPVLSIVYASIWRAMEQSLAENLTATKMYEMPIGTWKKIIADHGGCDKDDIKKILSHMGCERFESNDESDALAIAISGSIASARPGKDTHGRLMPLPGANAAKGKKKDKSPQKLPVLFAAKSTARPYNEEPNSKEVDITEPASQEPYNMDINPKTKELDSKTKELNTIKPHGVKKTKKSKLSKEEKLIDDLLNDIDPPDDIL